MVRKVRRKKRDGLAAVEVALVFPLLLLVALGAIRYGHLILRAQEVTNAARNGVRVGIRAGAENSHVVDTVQAFMAAAGMGDSGYTMSLLGDVADTETGNLSELTAGQLVTVQITVPVANVGVLQVPLFTNLESAAAGGAWDIGVSVTMAKEHF